MKAFTDIEQSKKLAEILPIESADMHYVRKTHDFRGNLVDGKWSYPEYGNPNSKHAGYVVQNFESYEKIPCWSLAALLEQLDDEITDENGNDYNLTIVKENLQYQLYYHDSWGQVEDIETDYYDDLVDACYEMILKLKEKDLL